MRARRLPPGRLIALVAVGGAAGALARTWLSTRFPPAPGAFPWATLGVNLAGAFALGWLAAALAAGRWPGGWVGPLVGTGFLGAATTFATVGLELHALLATGRAGVATAYLAASSLGGLAAVATGVTAGRASTRGRASTGGRAAARERARAPAGTT